MSDNPPAAPLPRGYRDPDVTIDVGRLLRLAAKNRARCFAVGAITFVIVLTICGVRVPQSYTSQISLSFPQSAQPTALNLLAGTSSTGSRYVGVLKSRHFAEQATRSGDVQRLCGFKSFEEAREAVQTGLSVTDNVKDSLVYVSVTLAGPPRFGFGVEAIRKRVKQAVAQTANAYTEILRDYIANSDTDRDTVLLRAADEQLRNAKQQYDAAATRLSRFVLQNSGVAMAPNQPEPDTATAGGASGEGGMTGQTGSIAPRPSTPSMSARELETLYIERGRLASEIQAETEGIRSSGSLRQSQLDHLGSLPAEDPLLTNARLDVSTARTMLSSLSLQFGPDHPDVRKAQERLRLAEAELERQTRAVARRRTTADVEATVALRSMLARQDKVNQLISAAEKRARKGVAFSQAFELRKNEMWLRLEVLRATASQAAILSLQTLSLKNRMAVVDTARPAKTGSPGLLALSLMSAFAACTVLVVYLVLLSVGLRPAMDPLYQPSGLPALVDQPSNEWREPAEAALMAGADERGE